ncbi:MAG: hypothetical protein U0359_30745 [Byssovorax sp.]
MTRIVFAPIATSAELQRMADHACGLLRRAAQVERDPLAPLAASLDERNERARRAAQEALRFCAAAAVQIEDHSMVRTLERALVVLPFRNDEDYRCERVMLDAIGDLLRAGAPLDRAVERLASDRRARRRAVVAGGLSAQAADAMAVLEKLAADPVAEVRAPARAALAGRVELPAWLGRFASDPLARLVPAEAAAVRETLDQLFTLLDQPEDRVPDRDGALTRLIGALPDPLAVEAAERTLRASGALPRLGAMMIARPGGIDALVRLAAAWGVEWARRSDAEHVRMILDAPFDVRLAACLALARYAANSPPRERAGLGGGPHLAAWFAGQAYPPGADLTPLLELICTRDLTGLGSAGDFIAQGLRAAFEHPEANLSSIAGRLIEGRLADFRGPHEELLEFQTLLLRLPRATLRAAAEEALASDDEETRSWGMGRLLFEAHDPVQDPDRLALARRFYDDPCLREMFVHDDLNLGAAPVSFLRADLRRGSLALRDAARAVVLIGALWGGRVDNGRPMADDPPSPEVVEEARAHKRACFAAFLGPEELHGPVTDDEWAAVRRARDAQRTWRYANWRDALDALPPGPWHPDDRAFLLRAVSACEDDPKLSPTSTVLFAMVAKPDASFLSLLPRLLQLSPELRSLMDCAFERIRLAVGMTREEAWEAAGAGRWEQDGDDEVN